MFKKHPLFRPFALLGCLSFMIACAKDTPTENSDTPSSGTDSSSSVVLDSLSSSSDSLSSSSSEFGDIVYTAEELPLIIEDFEDGDTKNFKGGWWGTSTDNGDGGESFIEIEELADAFKLNGGYKSNGYLQANFELKKGSAPYSPFVSFETLISADTAFSAAKFAGISFWHKGAAHSFKVAIPQITKYDYHSYAIPSHDEWTFVQVEFSKLKQGNWDPAEVMDLNVNQQFNLIWQIQSGNEYKGSFAIDDIRLAKEITYPIENNMDILAPSIPEALAEPGDVISPLNNLSKKYLSKGMNFSNWGEQEKIDPTQNPKDWKWNKTSVEQQAKQGIKGIRFPIDLDLYIVERDSVLAGTRKTVDLEPTLFAVLDSFNVWTKEHNVSFTIDHHAYDGTFTRTASRDSVYRRVMSTVWKLVAQHFVSEPREDLFLELNNEPGLSVTTSIIQSDWTSLAQMMIDSIRTVDATRPIIFGDTDWYSLDKLVANKALPFSDQNIIYAFHMYDPFIFTHQGAEWTDLGTAENIPFPYSEERWSTEYRNFGINSDTPDWVKNSFKNYYKEGNKTFIKNRLIKAKAWASLHQVPLICNEWGAYSKSAKIEDLNAYFKTMGEIFKELDISWQVWFGIFDDKWNLLPGMDTALEL